MLCNPISMYAFYHTQLYSCKLWEYYPIESLSFHVHISHLCLGLTRYLDNVIRLVLRLFFFHLVFLFTVITFGNKIETRN